MKDRTLQQQKSGRYFTAIDSTGIVVPLSSGTGLRALAVYAQSARLHWRTGGGDLVASDVQTYTQTTTAADPTIGVDQWEYIPLRETDTHIGFRAASGSGILYMFLLVDSPIDYYTDVVAPLGDVVAHWSGVASEYLIDRTGTYPAYLEGTWTVEDSLVKGGSNLAGFDGATAKATAAVLDGDFAFARTWSLTMAGWVDVDNVAASDALHPAFGNSLSVADPGATLYFEDRVISTSNQSVRAYFSRGDSVTSTSLASGEYLAIPDGKPHHVAVVADVTTVTLYYDGIVSAHTNALIATNAVDSDLGFSIGYVETVAGAEFFSELTVGEVTLFSAPKTDMEILTIYSEGGGEEHYYQSLLESGAFHIWPLERNSLDIATRSTGTESSGSLVNVRPSGRRMGQSLQFNGAGSYQIANGDIDFTLGEEDDWTILMMARVDSVLAPAADIGLFGFGTSSTLSHVSIFTIGTDVTGRIRDAAGNLLDGSADLSISVPTIKTDNKWRMYAIVMDRVEGTAYLYVVSDTGTLVDSAGDSGLGALTPSGSFLIGDSLTTTSWEGQISGVAVLQSALSQEKVEELYTLAHGDGPSEFSMGAVHYWALDGEKVTDPLGGADGVIAGTIEYNSALATTHSGSYGFDAIGDRITFAQADLNFSWDSDFSVLVWTDMTNSTNREIWVNKSGSSVAVGVSLLHVAGDYWVRLHDNSGNGGQAQLTVALVSTPALLAVVRSGTTVSIHSVYGAGTTETASLDISAVLPEIDANCDDLRVGNKYTGTPLGRVGRMSAYNRALALADIVNLYNAQTS